ncbi:MAG TPA: GAF and ANTAR domain-containing protein [Acidimicrobiales bacterium]|nr:GAF and ANTAR domain-containing protein [Acidimicrobiales bacterium]
MSQPRSEALHALSQFLVADVPIGDTLRQVADISVAALPNVAFVGITMLDSDERPTTAVFTDEQAREIDQAQYDTGRGPCLDAWRTKRPIRLDDLDRVDADYGEYASACMGHGIQSTLSMPLIAADRGVGALNFYSATTAGFSADDEQLAGDLASAASAVLANTVAYWGAYDLSQQLTEAMQSRAVIEQAKGMLMAKSPELSSEDAFDLLRRASQRENLKLRDIAQRIVDRRPISLQE